MSVQPTCSARGAVTFKGSSFRSGRAATDLRLCSASAERVRGTAYRRDERLIRDGQGVDASRVACRGRVRGCVKALTRDGRTLFVRSTPVAAAPSHAEAPSTRRRGKLGAYVALMKPRIIELLLVTTPPTMMLAHGGFRPIGLVLATLVGGTLAAGSANVLNCYLDRDIDKVMHRTKRRPLVTGEVTPREALILGLVPGAVSRAWLALTTNPVTAALTAAATLRYVVGSPLRRKR